MIKEHILVVEDEEDIQELMRYNLEREGYEGTLVDTGEQALQVVRETKPNVILLDLMLPTMNGLDVCKAVKTDENTAHIPVIIVSARGEEIDVVTGLELGADDYLTKPFSPRVLIARTRAVLRRIVHRDKSEMLQELIQLHKLSIDTKRYEVMLDNEQLVLTATEFRILHLLAKSPGAVFTRQQIVQQVHGEDYPVTDRSIDVQIAGLRKKLHSYSDYIETVRGIGYRVRDSIE